MAQNSASALPKADNISKGVLPDGVEYCLVSSSLDKGRADFALVQRSRSGDSQIASQFASVSKNLKNDSSPVIERREDAAILRFRSVPVFDKTIVDSTLLSMVNMMRTSPLKQTLVVVGDIDRSSLLEQIHLLSLSVPQVNAAAVPAPVFVSNPAEKSFSVMDTQIDSLARIRFTYNSPRLSGGTSGTIVPYLTNLMYSQMGIILENRLRSVLKQESIPVATLETDHLDSFHSSSDEQFKIELTVRPEDLAQALSLCAQVFSGLSADGVTSQEINSSKLLVSGDGMSRAMNLPDSNSEYVDFCVASILYGFEIPSFQSVSGFFDNRKMPVEKTLPIFNQFCTAIFSENAALNVAYSSNCGVCPSDARAFFEQGWTLGCVAPGGASSSMADTSRIAYPSAKKVKLKSVAADPLTGGEIWSFANGFRVIYKKDMTHKGEFQYGVFLRGGVQNIPQFGASEAAWASDMFDVYDIAGMDALQFKTFIQSRGVTYNCIGDFFDFRIVGKVSKNAAPEMMRCLSTLCTQRSINESSYAYFKSCESLRANLTRYTPEGTRHAAFKEFCPDSPYSVFKDPETLCADLPSRYDQYFTQQFEKFNDAVLVVVGDVDAEQLKTLLSKTIDSFPSVKHSYPRSRLRINLARKWKTTVVESSQRQYGPDGTNVQIDLLSRAAITPRNRYAFELLKIILENRLSESVYGLGYCASVSGNISLFPQESMNLSIRLETNDSKGIVSTAQTVDPSVALRSVRRELERFFKTQVSKEELEFAKRMLLNRYETQKTDTANLRDAALMRYSQGWDCFSGNAQMINAISPSTLSSLLKPMSGGSRCEYIVK